MDHKKLSVRAAWMELDFALVGGNQRTIEIGETQLKEALLRQKENAQSITTIPGGGMWAVGGTATATSNVRTLIEFHP